MLCYCYLKSIMQLLIIHYIAAAEEMVGEVVITPSQKLEDLIRLAELCVDLLRQNEEFYAEVTKNIIIFKEYNILKNLTSLKLYE